MLSRIRPIILNNTMITSMNTSLPNDIVKMTHCRFWYEPVLNQFFNKTNSQGHLESFNLERPWFMKGRCPAEEKVGFCNYSWKPYFKNISWF